MSILRCCRAGLVCLALGFLLLPAVIGQTANDGRAVLIIRLPAAASLTIDETPTKATGAERTFVTPPLTPGKTYAYTLVATWDDNGEAKNVTHKARVRAGERTMVDLTQQVVAKKEPKEEPKEEPAAKGKSRTFLLTYATTVTGLPEGQTARIWLPVPSTSPDQDVTIESTKDLPEGYKINTDKKSGNQYFYYEGKPNAEGEIPLSITYKVTRREVKGQSKDTATMEQLNRFLQADAMVPVDGEKLSHIKDKLKLPADLPKDDKAASKVFYDLVNNHMKYGKPKEKAWGRGDSVYAADECVGNCTDFHSLFITLARSQKIPAKFEIGFSVPEKRGDGDIAGYHCWAKFKPKGGAWVPVDISEANKDPKMTEYYFGNLTEDRVTLSSGRDLELIPKQDGPPRNFLVFPYVEVDGKEYAGDKVKRKVTYKDVE